MAREKAKKIECCEDAMSLPEEMEVAVRQRGGLEGLKSHVPDRKSLASEAELFHALSDPIRLQILHALLLTDLCPCLLKEITGLSNSKLSYHLSILEESRLVASSPRKKWRIYMLTEFGKSWIKTRSNPATEPADN
ncbi:MAG: metalloregulator ArsR/SmtB family transcription factor [Methanomassiliicoccales archaeon]|nr:metalloregulator ArsR/SmtB family transcription factor [Methanomassiliicoccales archaeon]